MATTEWRPIDTAPKDGTAFLVAIKCGDRWQQETARYIDGGTVLAQTWDHEVLAPAEYWMPLPSAPPNTGA